MSKIAFDVYLKYDILYMQIFIFPLWLDRLFWKPFIFSIYHIIFNIRMARPRLLALFQMFMCMCGAMSLASKE